MASHSPPSPKGGGGKKQNETYLLDILKILSDTFFYHLASSPLGDGGKGPAIEWFLAEVEECICNKTILMFASLQKE